MLFKLLAIHVLLFITFPVARLCNTIFENVHGFLTQSEADSESKLKTSAEEKVERLLDIWS